MTRWTLSPSARRWPLGLLGMVALVAASEWTLARHAPDLMSDVAFNWNWGSRSVHRREALDSEVLCFGDSLIKHGIAPKVVASRSGMTTYNLALSGGRASHAFFFLRRALGAGARPKALVIDAELLTWEALEHPYLWPQAITPVEAVELAWSGRDADFLAHYGLSWLLPSVRGRYEVRNELMAQLRGGSTALRAASAFSDRNFKANRGASIFPASRQLPPSDSFTFDTHPADQPIAGRWAATPLNLAYFDRFLDLADAHQVPVFWLLPPRYEMLGRYFEHANWNGTQRDFARDRLRRHPNLVIIDGLTARYDRTAVADIAHMNRRGAASLSAALGDILRDRLSGPALAAHDPRRWVDLPAFVEPPPDAPVEDMEQSIRAVAARIHEARAARR